MNKEEFAEFVREKRLKVGMIQWDFAEAIGCSWITVWRWENQEAMPKEDAIDFWVKKIKEVK